MIRRDVRKMRRRRFDPVHDSAARTVALLLALILVALAIAAIVEPCDGHGCPPGAVSLGASAPSDDACANSEDDCMDLSIDHGPQR